MARSSRWLTPNVCRAGVGGDARDGSVGSGWQTCGGGGDRFILRAHHNGKASPKHSLVPAVAVPYPWGPSPACLCCNGKLLSEAGVQNAAVVGAQRHRVACGQRHQKGVSGAPCDSPACMLCASSIWRWQQRQKRQHLVAMPMAASGGDGSGSTWQGQRRRRRRRQAATSGLSPTLAEECAKGVVCVAGDRSRHHVRGEADLNRDAGPAQTDVWGQQGGAGLHGGRALSLGPVCDRQSEPVKAATAAPLRGLGSHLPLHCLPPRHSLQQLLAQLRC